MRSASAASSASPQRRTDSFTRCQLQPSSPATSPTGRARPAWRVAQRAARVVSFSRGGAISRSCSVTVPAEHSELGQRHRRLLHQLDRPPERRQVHQRHRPLAVGPHRSATAPTGRPRRPQTHMHPQRRARRVVDAEHLHIAQSHQQLTHAHRVNFHRDPPVIRLPVSADSGGSLAFNRGPSQLLLHPQTRSAAIFRLDGLSSRGCAG